MHIESAKNELIRRAIEEGDLHYAKQIAARQMRMKNIMRRLRYYNGH